MSRAGPSNSKAVTLPPLDPNETERASIAGDRLRNELVPLLSKVRKTNRSALSLSRELGLDRNLTQKVVSATAPGVEGLEVLVRAPGPEALRTFVAAASIASGHPEPEPNASAAIEQFEVIIRELAGSQARLIQRIRGQSAAGADADATDRETEVRRRLFHDAADLLGVSVDLVPFIGLVRPVPDRTTEIHGINGYGMLGVSWDGGPLPIGSHSMALDASPHELVEQVRISPLEHELADQHGLIPEFCTKPLPHVSRRSVRGLDVKTIDPGVGSGNARVDLVFGQHWGVDSNPMSRDDEDERFWSQFVSLRRPTRRLVLDVYMHRSMAMSCVPHIAAYRWTPGLSSDPMRCWHERMPGRPRLEVLGAGLNNAASNAWPRHAEFANHLFTRSGWPSGEFVGYRCDIAYPIWSAAYYLTFDFRSKTDE